MGRQIRLSLLLGLKRVRNKLFLLLMILVLALACSQVISTVATDSLSQDDFKLNVALVSLDKDETLDYLIEYALDSKEIRESFNIISVPTPEEGEQMVEDNEAYACLILPVGFMNSLSTGENFSPTVIVNQSPSVERMIMQALIDTLVQVMRDAQGGIYTATDVVYEQGTIDNRFLFDSNLAYLRHILTRESTFEVEDLRYEQVLDVPQHYALTFVVYLLLLSTALFYQEMNVQRDFTLLRWLRLQSRGHFALFGAQLAVLFILYFLLFLGICVALGGELSALFLLSLFNATLLFLLVQSLMFNLLKYYMAAVPLNFAIHTLGLVAAGGIVPTLLLPRGLTALSLLSPLYYIRSLLSTAFVTVGDIIPLNLIVLVANIGLMLLLHRWLDRTLRRPSYAE